MRTIVMAVAAALLALWFVHQAASVLSHAQAEFQAARAELTKAR